jgi:hypothetical protein
MLERSIVCTSDKRYFSIHVFDENDEIDMRLQVESTVGSYGDQEPVAFFLGDHRLTVVDILDRWLATDYDYFKVLAEDDALYILRHDEPSNEWELTLFQARKDE